MATGLIGQPRTREGLLASTSTTSGPYSIPLASAGPWLGTYSATLPLVFAQDMAGSDVGIYTATDVASASIFGCRRVTGSIGTNIATNTMPAVRRSTSSTTLGTNAT
jgi:hypothetical protein